MKNKHTVPGKPDQVGKPGSTDEAPEPARPVKKTTKSVADNNLRADVAMSVPFGLPTDEEVIADQPKKVEPALVLKWCFQPDIPIFSSTNLTSLTPTDKKLTAGTIVTVKRQQKFPGAETLWSEISYTAYDKVLNKDQWVETPISGWVNDFFLDDYVERFPGVGPENSVLIPHPTANPFDAQQYMTLADDAGFADKVRYNMCGELCVAFILQDNIDNVVANWKKKLISVYGNILGGGKNETTSQGNLSDLLHANLGAYGFGTDADQVLAFKDKLTFPMSAERMKGDLEKALVTHSLIVLVKIDRVSGTLIERTKAGIDHWVVVDRLNGGWLELYNPFPNKREEYSFGEFYASCSSSWVGLWVKRKSARAVMAASPSARSFGIQLDTPKPANLLAEQYIAREGGVKHNLCGEFCAGYILGKSVDEALKYWKQTPPQGIRELTTILRAYGYYKDSGQTKSFTIGTVLDYWREKQPELYKMHVVGDKPTGTAELRTILKAYGYVNDDDITDFRTGLTDALTGQYLPSPGKMKKKLETHFLIAGVGIEGVYGKLIYDGPIRHWVVVEAFHPNGKHYIDPSGRRAPQHLGGNGGWVELYNPFTNVLEEYSYMEFTNSMSPSGNWYGMWVKRSVNPLIVPQEVLQPVADAVSGKDDRKSKDVKVVKKWTDQRMTEEIQKRIRNKVSLERILQSLAKDNDTGWSADQISNKIAALSPVQKKPEATTDDIEKTLVASQEVKAIQPEIIAWARTASKSNPTLAVELTRALRETGIMVVEDKPEQGKLARLVEPNESMLPNRLQAAIDNRIDSQVPASKLTQKVASVMVPLFISRAMNEIADMRAKLASAPKSGPV